MKYTVEFDTVTKDLIVKADNKVLEGIHKIEFCSEYQEKGKAYMEIEMHELNEAEKVGKTHTIYASQLKGFLGE